MTTTTTTLADLGWTNFYQSQLDIDEVTTTTPARVRGVHRTQISVITTEGKTDLTLEPGMSTSEIAIGDWVLCDPKAALMIRRLDRISTLQRGSDYQHGERQLIAANIDTLFITTSCNADFNVARLERYLALAYDADVTPVILLTKSDQTDDVQHYVDEAQALGPDLAVVALDARDVTETTKLAPWCGKGQTVALAGSSGVGKTTLTNALAGEDGATQGIREDDARGRHTTTGRSLHKLPSGGWLIDTPGMRGLGVADVVAGINEVFSEISVLENQCRFRDCKHEGEPGCAVTAAIEAGDVTPDRLKRFQKLRREDAIATETTAQARLRSKKFTKGVKKAVKKKKR
ncbi:ribosome small subunit-dependent GTPase A [Loktanella sp. F6476L]|uniref:ribosome small subunit-dependent GTPase A n=1 Tax=Loktanella sp. F6476L TaxID=2926405 RepID=UPI001FF3A1CA|nr:ribosome small subunit-dependent GTPase A [Loktanella sp. F6476L]MCK0121107.1 ribosome small subunit-dependent GTPase A [Loktanella sp. F6476L]